MWITFALYFHKLCCLVDSIYWWTYPHPNHYSNPWNDLQTSEYLLRLWGIRSCQVASSTLTLQCSFHKCWRSLVVLVALVTIRVPVWSTPKLCQLHFKTSELYGLHSTSLRIYSMGSLAHFSIKCLARRVFFIAKGLLEPQALRFSSSIASLALPCLSTSVIPGLLGPEWLWLLVNQVVAREISFMVGNSGMWAQ